MAFAYRDEYGILHVVGDKATADKFAGGPVKEVDVPNSGGYPTITVEIFDYGQGKVYIGGNRGSGKLLSSLGGIDLALADEAKAVLEKIGL